MPSFSLLPRAAMVAAALLVGTATAQAALINSYDFDGDFTDTLGNGLAMTASGGSLAGGRYSFTANQGLRLTSALPSTTDYAVEIRFQANDSLAGFNKLLDFQDLGSDLGLYVLNGGLNFFALPSAGPGVIALNTDATVGLARAAGSISVFLDGVLQFSAADGGGQAVPGGNVLNFFEDDFATAQGEAFVGSVDWIRIHDDASTFGVAPPAGVPEPLTLALMGTGLALTGCAARRRRAG